MEAGKTARAKVGKLTPREKAAEDRKSAAASSSPGIAATTTRATIDGPPRVEAQEYLGINAHPDFANTSDPYLDAAAAAVSSPAPMGTSNFRSSPIHVPSSPSPVVPSKPYTPRPAPTLYQMRRPVPLEPLPTPAPKLIPARGGAPPTGPQMGVFSSVVPRKRGASSPLEGEMGGKKGGK
ncbi:hypothetical protein BDV96DRAFT_349941 [Lophiotrema nucula]|uniref:Uncharacterized protein n=1 Tax=Lophiotrema nucula TaxID=690887 RepID=A0A6A5ZJQ0_9PLEO|nr:hypothetical protein BDV96DRAFT_349941 [Lophiotrema nucula]